jgi:hypothetical protein
MYATLIYSLCILQERMPIEGDSLQTIVQEHLSTRLERGCARSWRPGSFELGRFSSRTHGGDTYFGDRSCLYTHWLQFFRGEAWLASAGRVCLRFVASDGPAVAEASFDILFQECTRFDRFTEVSQ